ncbi:hypothetical protein NA78x_002245 [Anatilimnocola sp. NA78]|uniref:hypothetical protein n=1 Tax=Anatilimnocola sp. NA78 TaxID=3415683 RepID=UPI003CE4515D
MWDLWWGSLAIALVALAVFLFSLWLARFASPRAMELAGCVVVGLLFYYIYELWYDVRIARWLSTPNLILVGNWLPIIAAALAAIVWHRPATSALRRVVCIAGLAAAASFSFLYPLLGNAPACEDRWDSLGTCLQTTKQTCSPASAATLLRQYGIAATEQEMAELCLTRDGTSWQGLYRGLKLKTAGTPYDVEVVWCSDDQLRELADRPVILSVGLARGSRSDSDFTREFGWQPGVNHSVVLLEFDSAGNAVIADPSLEMCREHWSRDMLRTLWRGYAFRLVERKG